MNEEELLRYFISIGVKRDRAVELASRLALIDASGWEDEDLGRYVSEWADIAMSEQYQDAMAMYTAYADPRTGSPTKGRLWDDIMAEREYARQVGDVGLENRAYNQQLARGEAERRQAWETQIPDMPSQAEVATPFIEQLRGDVSPAAQRYFQANLGNISAQAGIPAARGRWWEEKWMQPKRLPTRVGGGDEEYEELLDERDEELARRAAMVDPWEQFLQEYDFKTRFRSLTPRERGEFTSTTRPRTRFL